MFLILIKSNNIKGQQCMRRGGGEKKGVSREVGREKSRRGYSIGLSGDVSAKAS